MPAGNRVRRVYSSPYPSREERLSGASGAYRGGSQYVSGVDGNRGTNHLLTGQMSLSTMCAYLRQCQDNINTFQNHRINLSELSSVANRCMNSTFMQERIAENQYRAQQRELLNAIAVNIDIGNLLTAIRFVADNRNMQPIDLINELMHCQYALNQAAQDTFQWLYNNGNVWYTIPQTSDAPHSQNTLVPDPYKIMNLITISASKVFMFGNNSN